MNTLVCRRCGLYNPPNASACGRCGEAFSPGAGATAGGWVAPSPYNRPAASKGSSTGQIVAIVVAVLAVGVLFIGIVAAIAIPSLIRARAAANESAAIGTLRAIAGAETQYFARNNKYGTLSELARAGFIDASLVNGVERNSYVFREVKVSQDSFEFCVESTDKVTTGQASYNVTQEFVIRYREGRVAPVGRSGTPIG